MFYIKICICNCENSLKIEVEQMKSTNIMNKKTNWILLKSCLSHLTSYRVYQFTMDFKIEANMKQNK